MAEAAKLLDVIEKRLRVSLLGCTVDLDSQILRVLNVQRLGVDQVDASGIKGIDLVGRQHLNQDDLPLFVAEIICILLHFILW